MNSKTIKYLSIAKIPSESAHSIQIVKVCEALSKFCNCVLYIPSKIPKHELSDKIFKFYGTNNFFQIRSIYCPNINPVSLSLKNFIKWLLYQAYSFYVSFFIVFINIFDFDSIIYTRQKKILFFLKLFMKKKIIYEIHTVGNIDLSNKSKEHSFLVQKFLKRILSNILLVVSITKSLKNKLLELGVKAPIVIAPDGVDLSYLEKIKINTYYDNNVFRLCYIGSLQKWKGFYTMLDSMKYLNDVILDVYGGTNSQQSMAKEYIKNKEYENKVKLHGFFNYSELYKQIEKVNLFLIPNEDYCSISSEYTSPLKLFEYMALNVPILASNVDSLREVLNENTANFFKPGDSKNLAAQINLIKANYDSALIKSQNAFKKVKDYTWDKRTEIILNSEPIKRLREHNEK